MERTPLEDIALFLRRLQWTALGVGACAVVADGEAVGEGGGAQAVGIGGQTVDGVGKEGTLGRAGGAVPGEERGGVAGQCEKPEEQRR